MTVGELMAELARFDPNLPVACLTYAPDASVASPLAVTEEKRRAACAETVEAFCGRPHWFALGTRAALYQEERGAPVEAVVVVAPA
jgi:hypothetical protein